MSKGRGRLKNYTNAYLSFFFGYFLPFCFFFTLSVYSVPVNNLDWITGDAYFFFPVAVFPH